MEGKINSTQIKTTLLYIFYAVGIAGHLLADTRELMIALTPYSILFSMIVVLWKSPVLEDRSFQIWFLITYIATFLIEVAGVKTGLIFGNYEYGEVMGWKLFDTPLIIGLNWVFLIWGFNYLTYKITNNKIGAVILPALMAVLFDYLMEPVAVKLSYWNWEGNGIPLQNYLSWFIISAVTSMFYYKYVKTVNEKTVQHFIFVQLMFFLFINILGE